MIRRHPRVMPRHHPQIQPLDIARKPHAVEQDRTVTGPHQLRMAAARVRDLFARVANAARAIADEAGAAPALPDDPAEVAFAVAARVEFELAARQRLLASRSALGRLDDVAELLEHSVGVIEERAATHERARSNGHGTLHQNPGAG
jgi:hypothetical protein